MKQLWFRTGCFGDRWEQSVQFQYCSLMAAEKVAEESTKPLMLHTRSRVVESATKSAAKETVKEATVEWNPKKTALIICDMWDNHWCKGAARASRGTRRTNRPEVVQMHENAAC